LANLSGFPHTPHTPCTLVLAPCACWALWTTPKPFFPPPIHRTRPPAVLLLLTRLGVHTEAKDCCACCRGGCGEVRGARGRRWRERKEAGALGAEEGEVGVWEEAGGWFGV
jgi:hypothetical protein